MLYHTGARNYSCELCGNKFFQMEHLKRHMQSIHNIIIPSTTPVTNPSQPKVKKASKQATSKVNRQKQRNISYLKNLDNFQESMPRQGPVITTISTETYQAQQCLRVTSRCMHKCQQCEFVSINLLKLNEHTIQRHSVKLHKELNCETNSDSFLSDEFGMNEYDGNENSSSDEFDEDRIYDDSNLNETV